jgi:hypothetical protein
VGRRQAKARSRENGTRFLVREIKALQVSILPTGIGNHGSERAYGESIARRMVRNNNATSVGVTINAVTTANPLEDEPVSFQGTDKAPRLKATWDSLHTLTTTAGSGSSIVP